MKTTLQSQNIPSFQEIKTILEILPHPSELTAPKDNQEYEQMLIFYTELMDKVTGKLFWFVRCYCVSQ